MSDINENKHIETDRSNVDINVDITYGNPPDIFPMALTKPCPWGKIARRIDDNFDNVHGHIIGTSDNIRDVLIEDYYKKGEVDDLLDGKQDTLVSGPGGNLKTVNGHSLLIKDGPEGEYNISINEIMTQYKSAILYTSWDPADHDGKEKPDKPTHAEWDMSAKDSEHSIKNIRPDTWVTNSNLVPPIWACNITICSDNPTELYDVSEPWRITGNDGENGADGYSVQYIYKLSKEIPEIDKNSTKELAINNYKWTEHPTGVSLENPIEYVCIRERLNNSKDSDVLVEGIKDTDGIWTPWKGPTVWSHWGQEGLDGDGVQYIFKRTTEDGHPGDPNANIGDNWQDKNSEYQKGQRINDSEQISSNNTPPEWLETVKDNGGVEINIGEFIPPDGWTDDPVGIEKPESVNSLTKEWCSKRRRHNGVWGKFSEPALWAHYVREVNGMEVYYAKSAQCDTGTPHNDPHKGPSDVPENPTSEEREQNLGWYAASPGVDEAHPYLWKKYRYIYKGKTDDGDGNVDQPAYDGKWYYELIGKIGERGIDGMDILYIFALTKEPSLKPSKPDSLLLPPGTEPGVTGYEQKGDTEESCTATWYDDPQDVNDLFKAQWMCYCKKKAGQNEWDQNWSGPFLWNMFASSACTLDLDNNTESVACDSEGRLIQYENGTSTIKESHTAETNVFMYIGKDPVEKITNILIDLRHPDGREMKGITYKINHLNPEDNPLNYSKLLSFTMTKEAEHSNNIKIIVTGEYRGVKYTGHICFTFNKILLGENAELFQLVPNCKIIKFSDQTCEPNEVFCDLIKSTGGKLVKAERIENIPSDYKLSYSYKGKDGIVNKEFLAGLVVTNAKITNVMEILQTNGLATSKEELMKQSNKTVFTFTLKYINDIIVDREDIPVIIDGLTIYTGNVYARTEADPATGEPTKLPPDLSKTKFGIYNPSDQSINWGSDVSEEVKNTWHDNQDFTPTPEATYVYWMSVGKFDIKGNVISWTQPIRISGKKGDIGADGNGMYFVYTRNPKLEGKKPSPIPESAGVDFKFTDTGDWTDSPQGVDKDNPFEYMSFNVYQSEKGSQVNSGKWLGWSPARLWSKYGVDGTDGDGVKYAFCLTDEIIDWSSWPTSPQGNEANEEFPGSAYKKGNYSNIDWYDDPQKVTELRPYEWVSITKLRQLSPSDLTPDGAPLKKWGVWSKPEIWTTFNLTKLTANAFTKAPEGETPAPIPNGYGHFNVDSNKLESLPSGWYAFDSDLKLDYRECIWMSSGIFNNDGENKTWTTPVRITGKDGDNGVDGKGMYYIFKRAAGISGAYAPVRIPSHFGADFNFDRDYQQAGLNKNGWTDSPQGVDESNLCELMCCSMFTPDKLSPNGGTWGPWIGPTIWSQWGKNGTDGDGIEYAFYLSRNKDLSSPSPRKPTGTVNNKVGPGEWTDDPLGLYYNGESYEVEWVSVRKQKNGEWLEWSNAAVWARRGEQGISGNHGRIPFPAGKWESSKEYIGTEHSAPYVYTGEGENMEYWLLNNGIMSSRGDNPLSQPSDIDKAVWIKMDKFKAIYADVGVLGTARVGPAVFYLDLVFSLKGVNGGNNYEDIAIDRNSGDISQASPFKPSIWFNFATGAGGLAGNKIKWDDKGEVTIGLSNPITITQKGSVNIPAPSTIAGWTVSNDCLKSPVSENQYTKILSDGTICGGFNADGWVLKRDGNVRFGRINGNQVNISGNDGFVKISYSMDSEGNSIGNNLIMMGAEILRNGRDEVVGTDTGIFMKQNDVIYSKHTSKTIMFTDDYYRYNSTWVDFKGIHFSGSECHLDFKIGILDLANSTTWSVNYAYITNTGSTDRTLYIEPSSTYIPDGYVLFIKKRSTGNINIPDLNYYDASNTLHAGFNTSGNDAARIFIRYDHHWDEFRCR